MFGLFKRKADRIKSDFGTIGVDMHSHLLPGIDDGAATVEDSVIMIRELMDMGIKKIITTPHIMYDYYRNTPETVNAALGILRTELTSKGINIPVEAAAEYFFDEHFIELVNNNNILSIGGKYVLIEFSFVSPPPSFIVTIQKLKSMGYQPVLAHPERYPYYTLDEFKNLKAWGFYLQINTVSLTGYYGKETKRMVEDLIENQMVDFISSDMHHLRHVEALHYALDMPYVQRLLKTYPLKNNLLL